MHKYVTWTWLVFIWWTVLVGTFDAIQLSLCDKIFSSSWLNTINRVICCIYLQLKASFRFMSQILKQLEFHQISARFTKNESDRSLMNFTKIKLGVSTTDVQSRSREARLIWTPCPRQWLIRSGLANEWPAYGRARNPWWLLAKAARSVHLDNHLNFRGVRKNPSTIGSMSLHNFSAVLETPDCEIMILI